MPRPLPILAAAFAACLVACALMPSALAQTPSATPSAPTAPPPPGACVEGTDAAPERIVADCDRLVTDKATPDGMLAGIFRTRAEAFVRQGRLRLAIDDLDSATRRDARDLRSAIKRADLRRTLGDSEALIGDLGAVIRLQPDNAKALFERGELYRAKGDRRRALADFGAVLRIEPQHEAATAQRKALAQEIERIGATMPLTSAPKR